MFIKPGATPISKNLYRFTNLFDRRDVLNLMYQIRRQDEENPNINPDDAGYRDMSVWHYRSDLTIDLDEMAFRDDLDRKYDNVPGGKLYRISDALYVTWQPVANTDATDATANTGSTSDSTSSDNP